MAKNKDTEIATRSETDTANEIADMSQSGSFMPDDFARFVSEDFSQIDSVLIGDPADGKIPLYVGQLIGPGEPIMMEDGTKEMPTWAFHPIGKDADGRPAVVPNVTHIIPASYMLHAACARISKHAEKLGCVAQVGIMFAGKTKTRKNLPLNNIKVFERYIRSTNKTAAIEVQHAPTSNRTA